MRRRGRHDRDIRRKGEACLRGGRVRAGGAASGPGPSSSPRSVQFRAEIGSVPHRDRSSSAPRSVRRGHARLPGSRDGHLCTRPAFPRESNGAVVGLTQKCRVRCAEAVRQWGCASADAGSGPLLAPGAVVGLEQECLRRRDHQRQILKEAEDTLGMPSSARPPVRAGRPRPRQAHRPGRGLHPYARPHPASGTRSHSS